MENYFIPLVSCHIGHTDFLSYHTYSKKVVFKNVHKDSEIIPLSFSTLELKAMLALSRNPTKPGQASEPLPG